MTATYTPILYTDPVSDVTITTNKATATIKWINPVSDIYHLTKVIQKIGSAPANLTDGTEVYSGTGTEVTLNSLKNATNYFWSVFAITEDNKYNPEVPNVNYIPRLKEIPSYSGSKSVSGTGDKGYMIIYGNGTLTFNSDLTFDAFVIGAGQDGAYGGDNGSRGGSGGNGGSYGTVNRVTRKAGSKLNVTIGSYNGQNSSISGVVSGSQIANNFVSAFGIGSYGGKGGWGGTGSQPDGDG